MSQPARRPSFAARFARAAAAALLAALGLTAASAGTALAADDVSWAVRTASNSLGSDRTGFVYTLDPGDTVDDALVVVNHGTASLDLQVYAADGFTTDGGQLDLLTRDDPSKAVGVWVRAQTGSLTLEPGAQAEVPFTVAVPRDATPGDYAGGIVTSLTRPDEQQGVNVDQRLGIRIDLHVGGEIAPAMAVEHLRVAYSGSLNPFAAGSATVTYTVHNTGNVAVSAQQAATAAGPFGWLTRDAGQIDPPPQLLPGETWDVTVPVAGVWPLFRVAASVTLTPLFTDASGSTTRLDAIGASASGWAMPWTALAVLLLVVALVVWALIRRRRAGGRRKAREDERVQEAVAQALRERAGGSQMPGERVAGSGGAATSDDDATAGDVTAPSTTSGGRPA
jgi:hypothetical protein